MDFLLEHPGELAALGAAQCWVFTALAFAAAGRRIGPLAVNISRILLALVVLTILHRVMFGSWIPELDQRVLILLGISGLIGLAIGDQLLFAALVDVGPRMATLMMTLAPPVAALLAWPMLNETLSGWQIVGIGITLAGVVWVVMERPEHAVGRAVVHRHRVRGIVFGALAGVCQAIGLVLAKLAMSPAVAPAPGSMGQSSVGALSTHIDPWAVTLVRMAFAAVGIVLIAAVMRTIAGRRVDRTMEISTESEHLPPDTRRPTGSALRFAVLMVCTGTVFGPVLGVWLSMVSVEKAEAGIAATLMAMSPVLILPFAVLIEKERISWRTAIGAAVAVVGVAVLTGIGASGAAS